MSEEMPGPRSEKAHVTVTYCAGCRWLSRATWIAQELLTTFESDIRITLETGPKGTFTVALNNTPIFDRKAQGRFPEPKELKQAIRDAIDPERSLGHSDRHAPPES